AAAEAVNLNAASRGARAGYDPVGGVAGIQLLDGLLERQWLVAEGERVDLTPAGEAGLAELGIDIAEARRARRAFAVGCLDWTERRVHLGGALGAAVLRRVLEAGHARLEAGTRVVRMKPGAAWLS